MSVSDVTAGGAIRPAASHGVTLDRRVQSVFSDVLEAAGRSGYASAKAVESDAPLEVNLRDAWSDWMAANRSERYGSAASFESFKEGFGDLLTRAHQEGGYVDPKGFLGGLDRDELETVRVVQSLADPIDVASLTEEGALNLLLPRAAQVDLNHDGITQAGRANGMKFPSSDTPAAVVEAWDAATAGLTEGERMMAEFQMMLPLFTANIEFDDRGEFVRIIEPGDPAYRNPMARDDYSYRDAVQAMLDSLEFSKERMPIDQYERRTDFWNRFDGELADRGAR